MALFTNAPLWVWPLFILLLVLGLWSTRDRQTLVAPIYALPLLGLLGLRTLASLPSPAWGWALWATAILLGGVIGDRLQSNWIISRQGPRVSLRGEWLTLAVIMVIFWSNFATGALRAVSPHLLASAWAIGGLAVALGLSSGSFLGRAIRTLRS